MGSPVASAKKMSPGNLAGSPTAAARKMSSGDLEGLHSPKPGAAGLEDPSLLQVLTAMMTKGVNLSFHLIGARCMPLYKKSPGWGTISY